MKTHALAAVTGIGAVCSLGTGAQEVCEGLYACKRRLAPSERISSQALPFPYFAVPDAFWRRKRSFSASDVLELALYAAKEALMQAGVEKDSNTGVVVGTTSGTALHFLSGYKNFRESGIGGLDCEEYLVSNPALAVRKHFRLKGAPLTLSNACVSGADAIGAALALLEAGHCDRVLCGGVDALSLVPHTGFARLMIYDPNPCRPFDRNRAGLNLGEGAAFMVLERIDRIREEDVPGLGYILGYGNKSDAYHITSPHPRGEGLETAVADALKQAGVSLDEIAFVNTHGTGTRENDKIEGQTLRRILKGVPLWCTKGLTGHTLGAAGTLEAVFSLWALNRQLLPPSAGFCEEDPEIGVYPVRESLRINKKIAVSTSLGFGGCNTALVLAAGDR